MGSERGMDVSGRGSRSVEVSGSGRFEMGVEMEASVDFELWSFQSTMN